MLTSPSSPKNHLPQLHAVYRHYKGDLYLIEGVATHSETGDEMVIYRALYGENQLYARPLSMFFDEVNRNGQKLRFELQDIKSVRD